MIDLHKKLYDNIIEADKVIREEHNRRLDERLEKSGKNNAVCDGCGNTGRGRPTLQEPDGVECECSTIGKISNIYKE